MIIFPAIDIQNGECVRLTKGDFATAERVAEDPVQTALAFKEAGAEWLHMVDLDGAKTAQMQNRDVFVTVARETGMKIELGGGIRDMKTAEYYLENGIERIILGSIAVKNPKLLAEMVREFGDRIVAGIDAQDGLVKIEGWQDSGRVNFITLAREMEYIGVQHVIFTDISRDGTLTGPNLAELRLLRDSVEMNVIASGGISSLADITALNNLKLYGAICGKSLYRETLDLKEAIAAGQAEPEYDPIPPRPAPRPEDAKPKAPAFRQNSRRPAQPAPPAQGGSQPRQQGAGKPASNPPARPGNQQKNNNSRPSQPKQGEKNGQNRSGQPPKKGNGGKPAGGQPPRQGNRSGGKPRSGKPNPPRQGGRPPRAEGGKEGGGPKTGGNA